MSKEQPLNHDKTNELATEFIEKITKVLVSAESSKESTVASTVALAHLLVMVTCAMVGKKNAVDVVTIAISKAFKTVDDNIKDMPS
jgi:hypothetical protein